MSTTHDDYLAQNDPKLHAALRGEEHRQTIGMELVASENYVSPSVLRCLGSVFTNKYSEGYPGKRYYGGQDFTDAAENLAIERAKELFPGAVHANVQPHSGCPANDAVLYALLEFGDTILGMDLSHGGHLSHGHPVTMGAKRYNFIRYKMKDITTGEIDYDELRATALEHKPKIILAGFSAYTRELDYAKFKAIADEVGALTWMDGAHIAGLIAGKQLANPFDHGFDIITSTTHKTLRGPRGGLVLTSNAELGAKIDKVVFPGLQGGPHMNNVAARAAAFGEALKPEFQEYAAQIIKNAKAMEEVFREQGIPMVAGGTDNHMLLLDVDKGFGCSGAEAEEALDAVHITLNKNSIPDDTRSFMETSGIRLGTPAMTTRGFKEEEFRQVARIICDAIKLRKDLSETSRLANEVQALCTSFPVPGL